MAAQKARVAPTDEELLKSLDDIPDGATLGADNPKPDATTSGPKPGRGPETEDDLLAQIDNMIEERPTSRSHTPDPPLPAASQADTPPKQSPPAVVDTSEAQPSSMAPSKAPLHGDEESFKTKTEAPSDPQPTASPTLAATQGWWGGLVATASAAVKTAEAAVKEIQQNEEAKRWTDQVKGNVGALRGLGGELRSRALPTFTNLLHTLAPPISAHERLQIHITHNMVGYPSLHRLIYQTFSRVMAQVEGGDLLVIQRGQNSGPKPTSETASTAADGGWSDGPWWRHPTDQRDLGVVEGSMEGTKLAQATAESYATEFFAPMGGVEEASSQAIAGMSETNPVRDSHIFLAIQAMGLSNKQDLFTEAHAEAGNERNTDDGTGDLIAFAVYLHDPEHKIEYGSVTQSFPRKWVDWMDAPTPKTASPPEPSPATHDEAESLPHGVSPDVGGPEISPRPEEIAEIMREGGADPREWVSEWIEEILSLGVGIVAQRYVARRMGLGQADIGKGKARQLTVDSGGGGAARAVS